MMILPFWLGKWNRGWYNITNRMWKEVLIVAEVDVKLPEEIFTAAKLRKENASEEVRKLIALELFRENAISMGKAAQIAGVPLADFMNLSARRGIPIHYTMDDLEIDRKTAERLNL